MESVGIFFGPLVCFTAIWNILLFRIFFARFGMFYKEKSGNTGYTSTLQTKRLN
jgi:hypothetical protein